MNSVPLAPCLALASCLALAGCAGTRPPPDPGPVGPGWSQTGVASWYGPGFHGRPTASGEIYDMEAMTAAHPWLPFHTRVRVENRENRRTALVRINDRGPFRKGRILDVSRAAARELGLLGPGTARVRLTVLELSGSPGCVELQVGAFREPDNARKAARRARSHGHPVSERRGRDGLVRVLVGPFEEPAEAERARARLGGFTRPCEPEG